MKRCDFIKLSASVALCLMVGLTLLSCSKKSNPVDQVLEESDLRSAVSVPLTQTQTTIEGQLPNDGGNHVGQLITIIDAAPVASDHCGFSWFDYESVVSDPNGGPSLTRTVTLPDILAVAVNDEFVVKTQTTCDGQYDLTLTPIVFNVSNKTTLCHIPSGNASNPITIEVSNHAVQAHLNHGDQLGPCL